MGFQQSKIIVRSAHRENVKTHFNRWLRKNRRVALIGLTSLVSIALLSGTYAWIADGLRRTAVNAKQAADMAKEAAESAKQAAIEQRDHADRNFQLAREAVDQYLTDVSQDPQLAIAGFQPLRKKLLDDASDYYQQFLAQRGDDAGVLRESAAAHHRLASIYSVLGQFDRGLEAADRASQQYSLLASKDHSPLLQLEIAECELERAQLLTNVGKLTEAKVLADKINEQLKSSNRELNGSLRLPAALAASYDLVASIAIRLNDRPTMTTAIEESQKLRQAIVSESPTLNALLALVATRMNASSSAAEQRNFEAAISSYQHSLSELEAHSDMDRSTAILDKRAELTHLLGAAYSGKGDDRSAIESFQKAIELREELVARNTVAGYQMDLAKSYSDLSVLRRRANQPEQATNRTNFCI